MSPIPALLPLHALTHAQPHEAPQYVHGGNLLHGAGVRPVSLAALILCRSRSRRRKTAARARQRPRRSSLPKPVHLNVLRVMVCILDQNAQLGEFAASVICAHQLAVSMHSLRRSARSRPGVHAARGSEAESVVHWCTVSALTTTRGIENTAWLKSPVPKPCPCAPSMHSRMHSHTKVSNVDRL